LADKRWPAEGPVRLADKRWAEEGPLLDPGRERRAERRARELLRSCVGEEAWQMYCELGFLCVPGGAGQRSRPTYAYLIYPHKPIVAYLTRSGRPIAEYCVEFPDQTRPYGSSRLPDSDDVLAKWMALTGDERRLIESANMHLPGHQLDAAQIARDIWRLRCWERARARERIERAAMSGAAPRERAAVSGPQPGGRAAGLAAERR
jgi:hypothetical protein